MIFNFSLLFDGKRKIMLMTMKLESKLLVWMKQVGKIVITINGCDQDL